MPPTTIQLSCFKNYIYTVYIHNFFVIHCHIDGFQCLHFNGPPLQIGHVSCRQEEGAVYGDSYKREGKW